MGPIASRSSAVRGGFPGLAIVSLLALLLTLAGAALVIIRPWAPSSLTPSLSVSPGVGIGLGDSVAVAPPRSTDVGNARVADAGHSVKSAPAVVPAAKRESEAAPELAVARARPLTRPVSAPQPAGPPVSPSPAPPAQAQPQPPATPVAVPVSAPPPAPQPEPAVAPPTRVAAGLGGGPQGPIGAGVGGSPNPAGAIQVREGDEYAFSFPLWLDGTEYEAPGVENLIMRFMGDVGESPSFGLQLWDDGNGGRGLWSSGDAMGGERFLAPVAEGEWHEVAVFFRASSEGAGFYLLFLDGQPIDARAGVSLIGPGSSSAQIDVGLFRNGELVSGSQGVLLGAGVLSDTLEPILP